MGVRHVLLEHADEADLTKLAEYERFGGYAQLRRALAGDPLKIKEEVLASGIRGRGGAAFPMGRKMQFVPTPDKTAKPIYFVVNADESEPGTFKDREIMLRVPHLLIEGVLISSFAIGARHAFIYLRGEYVDAYETLRAALDEAESRGLVGANVLGSGWSCSIVIHRGAGAYICGEETALLDSLEGKRGKPRTKPPFPGDRRPVRLPDRGQQRRDGRVRAEDHGHGWRGLRGRRRRELDRHATLLALRQRRPGWELRARAR